MKSNVRWAKRFYTGLLSLYSADFRRAYGDELILLFVDMYCDAQTKGKWALFYLWRTVLLDVITSAVKERTHTMITQKTANGISLLLILPFLFLITTAVLNYEPPFAKWFTEADSYTPTMAGRGMMILLLGSVPLALGINLLPRFRKGRSVTALPTTPFVPTIAHSVVGLVVLGGIIALLSQQLSHELRPFVAPLGMAAGVGQAFSIAALLVVPIAFLLNRVPTFMQAKTSGVLSAPPISMGLIVGAAILLLLISVGAIIALEATACSIGVPNCD